MAPDDISSAETNDSNPRGVEIVNPSEAESFQDVPFLKRLLFFASRVSQEFYEHYFVFVYPEPENGAGVEEWKQFSQTLDENLAILGDEHTPEQPKGMVAKVKTGLLSEKKRVQAECEVKWQIINNHNKQLNDDLSHIAEAIVIGESHEEVSRRIEEVIESVDHVDDPGWHRRAEKFRVDLEDPESGLTESAIRFAQNEYEIYSSPDHFPNQLRGIAAVVNNYRSRAEQAPIGAGYEAVTMLILNDPEKKHHVRNGLELARDDVGTTFYLPQLNLEATLSVGRRGVDETGLYFATSKYSYLPVTENLIAIPSLVMFPPGKAEESIEELKVEIEEQEAEPEPKNLKEYLDRLQRIDEKPDPDEVIEVPVDLPDEIQIDLILKGINPFRSTRRELLEAGYEFINAVGGGEKFIIKMVIDGVDYGRLPLLTGEQMEKVRAVDRDEFGELDFTPQQISADMYDLLHAEEYLYPQRKEEVETQILAEVEQEILDQGLEKDSDQALKKTEEGRKRIKTMLEAEWEEWLEGGNDQFGRRMPLEHFFINRGREHMGNKPCPHLSCGYRLGRNTDHTFSDADGTVRLSTVVAHLASHGISERGDGYPMSDDQRYMTMRQYYDLMMAK